MPAESSALFRLIQSLTKMEKRFISIKLRDENTDYQKLFKLILKQKVFDEEKIREQFNTGYISKHFSWTKSRLYHSIFRMLNEYNANKKDINYSFSCLKTLYEKGLYKDCCKMLKSVYKQSLKEENYLSSLRLIELTKKLVLNDLITDKKLDEIIAQEKQILKNQEVISTLQSLQREVIAIIIRFSLKRGKKETERLKEIQKHPYLQNNFRLTDQRSKQLYHSILIYLGKHFQNQEQMIKHSKELNRMINDQTFFVHSSENERIVSLQRQIALNSDLGLIKEFKENVYVCKKLLNNANQIPQNKVGIFLAQVYILESHYFLHKESREMIENYFEELSDFIEKYKKKVSPNMMIYAYSNLIAMYFMCKQYKKVQLHCNTYMSLFKSKEQPDLFLITLILEILSFYESSIWSLFESRLISFNRHLSSLNKKRPLYTIMAKFFSELNQMKNIQIIALDTHKNLHSMVSKDLLDQVPFLTNWLESKIKK